MRKPAIFTALLLLLSASVAAQDRNARASLEGLSAIPVQVQSTKSEEYLAGQIQNFAELRLRLAGIKVPSDNAVLRGEGNAMLYITIMTKGWLYIEVKLKQNVTLARRPSVQTYEQTWNTGMMDPNVEDASEDTAKNEVGRLLDDFINDYLAVNPKR